MSEPDNNLLHPFQPGQQISHYQIIEAIAPVKSGQIYLARDTDQPVQVLLEALLPPLQEQLQHEFLTDALALKQLEHPHLLSIQDVGVEEDTGYLVSPYSLYRPFSQIYPSGRIQRLSQVLPHLRQITSALQYLHDQETLHGDVRPENILVGANKTIHVRGIELEVVRRNRERARYQPPKTMLREIMGYAAPEQIQEKAGKASDQYALAMLIYELLSGQMPFQGSTVEIAFQKIHAPAPTLRQKLGDRISPLVDQVVMRALERDPARRYLEIQDFLEALDQAHRQAPTQGLSGLFSRPQRPVALPPPSPQLLPPPSQPVHAQATHIIPPSPSPASNHSRPLSPPPAQYLTPPVTPVPQFSQPLTPVPPWPEPAFTPVPPPPPRSTRPARRKPQPQARRRQQRSATITRRVFAVGLVGVAAASGYGGWYLLQQRFAHAANKVLAATPTAPPAKKTTVNHKSALIFTGHLASVNAVAWSPDGQYIASASDDTFVQVFEVATGKRKILYRGHGEEVAAVAWSPNGLWLASGGQDQTVQVWRADSGAHPLFTYTGHSDRVNDLSWSANSQKLVSGSDDQTVQVWQALDGHRSYNFHGHRAGVLCVGWQPDETSVASGSWDGTLRDWAIVQHGDHFNAGEQIFVFGGHGKNEVTALAWSSDSNFIVSAGSDQTVQISNGGDGTPRPPSFTDHRRKDHVNRVFAVSWSPDGTSIASGDEDGLVYVWNAHERKTYYVYRGHTSSINAVAWSPDGQYIASASSDATVHVWRPA